ncbi:hypothetical protein JYU34_006667 [Plutella xylostella]|uniref:RRM domain-containing protein n=1 Tax=Plutella xylostella TaxID=51655 RepID=A0ABQ7QSK3_PLUXY|nr:hypothetical protein JYU34_006667 [Plutella xylostella]
MESQEKVEKPSKTGFVIKLSSETVEKLTREDINSKVDVLPSSDSKQSSESSSDAVIVSEVPPQNISEHEPKETPSKDANSNTSESTESKQIQDPNASWGDYAPYVTYEGEEAIYTDPSNQQRYSWDKETNSWKPNDGEGPGRTYSYENDEHTYTEPDGSKFFWDADKKAWIPKVDDDFLALYQMSYGFVDNTSKEKRDEPKETKIEEVKKAEAAGVKRKSEPQWFQPSEDTNTKVYVSNLPTDITEEEFVDFMQKCGLVMRDPSTQKMKIKFYMDKEHNCFKGDALCTYIKIESVELALNILDGSDFKGNKIKVERAQFQQKGEYNPALKPKKKKKKELEKIKKMQQKLFDWRPEKFIGERSKHERVVIVKNVFDPADFDKDVQLILDYQQDLREEFTKCGEVRKVTIYDRHPEGVCQVTMKEPEEADAAVALINGRWFGKRQLTAEIWDGRTKYRIAETDADINKRIDKWGRFLEEGEKEDAGTSSKDDAEKKVVSEETTQEPAEMGQATEVKVSEPAVATVDST